MAERRMFAKTIIDSDAFLEMPATTQNLYFHLSMRADDDGFINNPKRISRMIGASDDDLKMLALKSFIIPFDTGIVVIKHWRINNYIRNDRYKETVYTEEKAMLTVKENGGYSLMDTDGIPNGYQMDTIGIPSIGKDSIGKDSIGNNTAEPKTKRFQKPTVEDIRAYCIEKGINNVDPEHFCDYYESNGWKVGRNPIKDWRATVRNWSKNGQTNKTTKKEGFNSFPDREVDYSALERQLLGY